LGRFVLGKILASGKSGSAVVCSKTRLFDIDIRLGGVVADGETLFKKRPHMFPENLLRGEGIDAFSVEFRLPLLGLTPKVISALFKDDVCT
jgi:hypothetical protein